MTNAAKQNVLRQFPGATCRKRPGSWTSRYVIEDRTGGGAAHRLGYGSTKKAAWRDAETAALANALK